jgi:hypothetical protein
MEFGGVMSVMTKCSVFLSSGISVLKQPSGSSTIFRFLRPTSDGLLLLLEALLAKFEIARLKSRLGKEADVVTVVVTGVIEGVEGYTERRGGGVTLLLDRGFCRAAARNWVSCRLVSFLLLSVFLLNDDVHSGPSPLT